MVTTARRRPPQTMRPHGSVGRLVVWLTSVFHGEIHRAAARLLQIRTDDDVLDVACGDGTFLRRYAVAARSIAGIDFSEVAIGSAIKKHRHRVAEGTAEFVLGDAASLPWPAGSFSAVSLMGSFAGLQEPEAALRELRRVLRAGGRALVSAEINAEDGRDHTRDVARSGAHLWRERELGDAMYRAGFTDVRVTYVPLSGLPKAMFVLGQAP